MATVAQHHQASSVPPRPTPNRSMDPNRSAPANTSAPMAPAGHAPAPAPAPAPKKGKGKKAPDPSEQQKQIQAKIAQLELDAAGDKEQELEIGAYTLLASGQLAVDKVPRVPARASNRCIRGAWKNHPNIRIVGVGEPRGRSSMAPPYAPVGRVCSTSSGNGHAKFLESKANFGQSERSKRPIGRWHPCCPTWKRP